MTSTEFNGYSSIKKNLVEVCYITLFVIKRGGSSIPEQKPVPKCRMSNFRTYHVYVELRLVSIWSQTIADRGSQIAKCSAIVCDHMETHTEDRTMFYLPRSPAIVCDRLRSIAIVRSYGNQSSAICDRNVPHNIFNSDPRCNSERFNKATECVYHRNGKDFTDKNKKANCWERIMEKFNLSAAKA